MYFVIPQMGVHLMVHHSHGHRMAAKINAERRSKSQKAKPKTSVEAGKNLSSVRVVQRNLVYIIGLPSNLCDESVSSLYSYSHFNFIFFQSHGEFKFSYLENWLFFIRFYVPLQVLERKQYFGQYGKVLNVSITRPTGATQQASSTNTFCV